MVAVWYRRASYHHNACHIGEPMLIIRARQRLLDINCDSVRVQRTSIEPCIDLHQSRSFLHAAGDHDPDFAIVDEREVCRIQRVAAEQDIGHDTRVHPGSMDEESSSAPMHAGRLQTRYHRRINIPRRKRRRNLASPATRPKDRVDSDLYLESQ